MDKNISAEIKKILIDLQLIDPRTGINGLILLGPGGVLDSFSAMRFITITEQRFGVDIMNDLNLDALETTDSLITYIESNLAKPVTLGQHLIMDCVFCPDRMLQDVDMIQSLIRKLAAKLGTEILQAGYHQFSPMGITGFAIVSASHIIIHTWPEYGYMGIDIFSCRDIVVEDIVSLLEKEIVGVNCNCRILERKAVSWSCIKSS